VISAFRKSVGLQRAVGVGGLSYLGGGRVILAERLPLHPSEGCAIGELQGGIPLALGGDQLPPVLLNRGKRLLPLRVGTDPLSNSLIGMAGHLKGLGPQ
jgi:hypothetical protein